MNNFVEIKENLLSLLEPKKDIRITNTLSKLIKTKKIPLKETYDLMGALTTKDPRFFMKEIYPKMWKKMYFYTRKHFKNRTDLWSHLAT